jgi:hypothetical protein
VIVGLIAAEIARLLLWFGVPLLALVSAFAAGLGTPTFVLSTSLVLVPIVSCMAVWGYAFGIGILRLLRHVPRLRRVLKGLTLAAFLGFMVASQLVTDVSASPLSLRALRSGITVEPMEAYVSLAFVGTSLSQAIELQGLIALLAFLGLTPLGLLFAVRQARVLWFTDGPTRSSPGAAGTATSFSPPWPLAARKATRIAWGFLLRAVRNPQELSHLLMIVFLIGPLGSAAQQASSGIAPIVGGSGVVIGVYLSGATFGLNPLGDERPQLPLLLLTETPPQTFLLGRLLAGLAVGLPIATLVPILAFSASAYPWLGPFFALLGVGFCLAAGLLALGLGCAYPIYEERKLWGAETVAPSMLVLAGFSTVATTGTGIGLAIVWATLTGELRITMLYVAGTISYLLATIGVPLASFRYAARRYGSYTLD